MNHIHTATPHGPLPMRTLLVAAAALLAIPTISAAAITVDADPVSGAGIVIVGNDGLCSLREAIINSNDGAQTHADCGTGTDITLPEGAVFTATDAAVSDGLGRTALPYVTESITLQGNGATIESGNSCDIDGTQTPGEFRLFLVQGALVTQDLTLANGCADGSGAAREGGAIHVAQNSLRLERTTIRDSRAFSGGAIYLSEAFLTVEYSTFSSNTATEGGALNVDGITSIFNSTLSGNSSASLPSSVFIRPESIMVLEHVTIDGGEPAQPGEIYASNGNVTVEIKNSILDNTQCVAEIGPQAAVWNASGNNLDSGSTCANSFGSNFTAQATPELGPLADNGGSTPTHALLPGSEAIDGAPSCTRLPITTGGEPPVTNDQREIPRPQGVDCDIGAFEVALPPQTIYVDEVEGVGVVDVVTDGLCSLREALENATGGFPIHADCEPGGTADTVVLPEGAVFTLSNGLYIGDNGSTGLPPITSEVFLSGQGATIQRNSAAGCNLDGVNDSGEFRLLLIEGLGNVTVEDLTLANGCSDGGDEVAGGGAIAVNGGNLTLRRSTVRDSMARGSGGGILTNSSQPQLIEASTLTGNMATSGGALALAGVSLTVRNSTLSGNSASEMGGAVFVTASTANLENTTLAQNFAPDGGGIKNFLLGAVNVRNVILQNSTCADVTSTPVPGNWNATGNNLDSGSSCALAFLSNITPNVNSNIAPLAPNGGTTATHALLSGSPAINAASDCTTASGVAIVIDQRGVARPQEGTCDIGAYEFQPQPPPSDLIYVDAVDGEGVVPVLNDGLCSLREAIENADSTSASFAHGDCEKGNTGGLDQIALPSDAVFTLTDAAITAPFGNTGLPATSSLIAIRGNGATIQSGNTCNFDDIQSAGEFRFFLVRDSLLGLENLTLVNGCADGPGTSNERDGGAIYVEQGFVSLEDTTVRDSRARRGGAIFSRDGTAIRQGTLSGNIATFGGALFTDANASMINTTISDNSAFSLGGAVFLETDATLVINQSTFVDNTSGQSNGIYASTATINAKNVIFRDTDCRQNTDATLSTWNARGNNLDSGNSCANLFESNFLSEARVLLGPLADNGGATQTHALLPGSRAINAAAECTQFNQSIVIIDQRGIERPQGAACDIGAFESRGFTLAIAGGNNQSAGLGQTFASPLSVSVTPIAAGEPVDGGVVSFLIPPVFDARASLAQNPATISGGLAMTAATANTTAGSYTVIANTEGSSAFQVFTLTNSSSELSIDDVAISEGNTGTSNAVFTVTRSNDLTAFSVPYSMAAGTAQAETDFTSTSGTLNFTVGGALTQTIAVPVVGDLIVEAMENATLELGEVSNTEGVTSVIDGSGLLTINDNDSAVVTFNPVSVRQSETASPMTFTVTLSNPVQSGVSLDLNSTFGTATAADFTPIVDGIVSFPANNNDSRIVEVVIINDSLMENDESFTLALSGLTAMGDVTLGAATATGIIEDDDLVDDLFVDRFESAGVD